MTTEQKLASLRSAVESMEGYGPVVDHRCSCCGPSADMEIGMGDWLDRADVLALFPEPTRPTASSEGPSHD